MEKNMSLTREDFKKMEAEVIHTMKDRALYPVRHEKWLRKHPEKAKEVDSVRHEEFMGYARDGEKQCRIRFEKYLQKYGNDEAEKLRQQLVKMEERTRKNY